MASWKWPSLINKIRTDVPGINALLNSLFRMDPTGTDDIPNGAKRLAETSDGMQFQVFNGSTWNSVGKLDHDAQTVDGFSASQSETAGTIPVRNPDRSISGNITGNAATATTARGLSETLPLDRGGTGATTASGARTAIGAPPSDHSSMSTAYGVGNLTKYGHLKLLDSLAGDDANLNVEGATAVTPFALSTVQRVLMTELQDATTVLDTRLTTESSTREAQDTSLGTAINNLAAAVEQICPIGIIVMFGGTFSGEHPIINGVADTRWVVCDGSNGTPNLVGRFILASNAAEVGGTGGSNTHTHTVSGTVTVTVNSHTLSASQVASHSHTERVGSSYAQGGRGDSAYRGVTYDSGDSSSYGTSNKTTNNSTASTGSSGGHSHGGSGSFTGGSAASSSNIPVYYKLAFIKRIS